MAKKIITCLEDFEALLGKELGVSEYHKITQEQINKFAEATLDFQWIHTDEKRAKEESPFKSTISHGYLNLSLLPYLWDQIVDVQNLKLIVNYGIEKLRFNQAVLVNDELRLKASVKSVTNLRGIVKTEVGIVLEIKDKKKSALEATVIFLYHFNS